MRVFQTIHAPQLGPRASHDRLVNDCGVMAPALQLVYLRLSLFVRVVLRAPPSLLGSLWCGRRARRSWIASVEADFEMLATRAGGAPLPSFGSLAEAVAYIKAQPRKFKSALFKACADSRLGASRVWSPSRAFSESLEQHPCALCSAVFTTRQKLAVHSFSVHRVRGVLHDRVEGDTCPCCLMCFHTRSRLLAHIQQKSQRCSLFVSQVIPPMDENVLGLAIAEDAAQARLLAKRGRRRVFAEEPAVRAYGPLRFEAVQLGVNFVTRLKTQTGAAYLHT